jgi:hypothetical protein
MEDISKTMTEEQRRQFAEAIAAEGAELSIEELDTVAGGLSVSSLLCAACPVSCFSSVSN